MRFFLCFALFFLCLAIIPSVESDRRKYTHDDDDDDDFNRFRKRYSSDEDVSVSKSDLRKREKIRRQINDAPQKTTSFKEEKTRKGRRFDDTDEDYTSEDLSDVCVNKRGRHCDSDDFTDEDYTDESDEVPQKKRHIYIKKFPHEKRKQKQDKETGTILKIHRKAGGFGRNDDDVTSEEVGIPKRRRYVFDDDDE